MDDLDRLFQRLVHNIRNGHAEYLSVPFTVQELYDTLVPYRHYRRDLGIETNQDYEAAVTRLLAGEKGYVRADKGMQDRLKKEIESPSISRLRRDENLSRSRRAAETRSHGPSAERRGIHWRERQWRRARPAWYDVHPSRHDGGRRGLQVLRRNVTRRSCRHLLPALRSEPRREALRGMRCRARSNLEVLYQLRKEGLESTRRAPQFLTRFKQ